MEALAIVFVTFIMMEGVSYLIHKYIMHGFLWRIHKTHHEPRGRMFEKNDLFSLFFGLIAITLIYFGSGSKDYRFWMGIGITLYGFSYFLLHDVVIHKRIKMFSSIKNQYLSGLRKAHMNHHKASGRKGAGSYGLLWVPFKYFKRKNSGGNL